ncbi:MAG: abortive infection family protein [Bacteroidetes bacterium]|nr:abortive infection family protein [Bacteroidota bacterium]
MFEETILDKLLRLQNGLIAVATSGAFEVSEYKELRDYFAKREVTKNKLPDFVRRCTDLAQFWQFIKYEKPTYRERRELLWKAFQPLKDYIESNENAPGTAPITDALESFDPDNVQLTWQKALDRRTSDPEGAITAARTLLETVCKYILDDAGITYSDEDLPKLWGKAAEQLNLSPSQHQEQVFKTILGNCQSIVNTLGTIRNRLGDSDGQGRKAIKPKARHAELAVNLAGTMASFIVSTWKEKKDSKSNSN